MSSTVLYQKGEVFRCTKCRINLYDLKKDIVEGALVDAGWFKALIPSMRDPINGEPFECPNCGLYHGPMTGFIESVNTPETPPSPYSDEERQGAKASKEARLKLKAESTERGMRRLLKFCEQEELTLELNGYFGLGEYSIEISDSGYGKGEWSSDMGLEYTVNKAIEDYIRSLRCKFPDMGIIDDCKGI